ncbi:MAG: DUF86 domain-containing protein [Planctomycetes bacterium]|nr:DUF86 domain-containing protein [Planctomycetota bacterium]
MSEEKRDYVLFMEDIVEMIGKIDRYTQGKSFKDFSEDEKTIDAVIRNFEIIGEAARNIPKEIQEKYPYVEWKEMIGFRNVIIHDYFGINLKTIWNTIKNHIPQLKGHIVKMKADYELSNH